MNRKLNSHIQEFLDGLETEDGIIIAQTEKISQFQAHMDEFFEKYGVAFLAYLAHVVNQSLKEAVKQFEDDGAEYEDVKHFEEILGIKGDKVVKKKGGQSTVLYALASMVVIQQDVINKMQSAMFGESSLKDFKEGVFKSVNRKFHDFVKVHSLAVLFNTFNAASFHFAREYDYKKFRYEGGLIADSRDFCVERDGHEFWIEQGKEWNELEWAGKMPGVDFFVQAGGYNCRHWLIFLKD